MLRWVFRVLLVVLVLFLFLPYLIVLPAIGIDAEEFTDPNGYFIDVDGLKTYVQEVGEKDAPPVILLHGWGASTFTWRENMNALAEAGYRAVAFDRPPYGLSAKEGDSIAYSLSGMADFTAKVMDTLGIDKAVMVGQSQGGGVVGYFAVKYPERVEKLVFVSAALRPSDGEGASTDGGVGTQSIVSSLLGFHPIEWWARVGVRTFVKPDFATNLLRSAYFDPVVLTPDVAEGYNRSIQVIGWDQAFVNQLKLNSFQPEPVTSDQIAGISSPVMIVWGQEDTWVPLSVGEQLKSLMPSALMVVYPNVGHLPQEESAESFNRDLIDFLKT